VYLASRYDDGGRGNPPARISLFSESFTVDPILPGFEYHSFLPSTAHFELDERWKNRIKDDIDDKMRPAVDEAMWNYYDTSPSLAGVERVRLTEEYLATMMGLRNQAEQQFRIAVEREEKHRSWAAGQTLDSAWRRSAIQEEQAILDSEGKHKLTSEVSESHSHGSVPGDIGNKGHVRYASCGVGLYSDAQDGIRRKSSFSTISVSSPTKVFPPIITPEEDTPLISHLPHQGSAVSATVSYRASSAPDTEGDHIFTLEQGAGIARDNDRQRSYARIDNPASSPSTPCPFEEAAAKQEDEQNEDKLRRKEEELHRMADGVTRKAGISPYSETTATEEQCSEESAGSASDVLEDLSDQLQGRSNLPTMSGGFGDIWKCELVKPNEIVQVCRGHGNFPPLIILNTMKVAVKTIRAFESDDDDSKRKNSRVSLLSWRVSLYMMTRLRECVVN
jgi:hypothetical protein